MPTDHGTTPTTPEGAPTSAPADLAAPLQGTAIRSAEVLVSSPDRNFVTLRLTTQDGVVGLGDATLNGRELAVASYLSDHVVPLLLGRDAHRIEDTWQFLYRSAYWRRGPVTMAAIAAVDVALWDIKAKLAGMPLYQLLGGASRTGIMAYGHASGRDLPELFDSIRKHQEQGFRSIRVQTSVPGIDAVYGVAAQPSSSGRYDYEPAQRAPLPAEEDWDTRAYLRHIPPGVRGGPERVRARAAAAARRAPPDDAHPGRAPGQGPRAVRPVLARGLHPRGEPGRAAAGPPAHHHPAGDR